MNMSLRHTLPSLFVRPLLLLGAGALVLGLLLSGCGGGGSGTATGQAGTCTNPDTHCAPKP